MNRLNGRVLGLGIFTAVLLTAALFWVLRTRSPEPTAGQSDLAEAAEAVAQAEAPAEAPAAPAVAESGAVAAPDAGIPDFQQAKDAEFWINNPIQKRLLAEATLLESKEYPADANGVSRRVRIMDSKFKYPKIRVEEWFGSGASGGKDKLVRREISVADHVLVKLQDGATEEDLKELVESYGGSIRRKQYAPGHYLVALPEAGPESVPNAVQTYEQFKHVLQAATVDYLVFPSLNLPNDLYFAPYLWGLHNTGQDIGGTFGTVDADIDAAEAWGIGTGSTNIVIGVIDTGIQYDHPDLAANIWTNPGEIPGNLIDDDGNGFVDDVHGYDFQYNDGNPMDDHSHGSHCAGTIGGVGNNSIGVAGVCWNLRIMAIKFIGSAGGNVADGIDAIYYGTRMKVRLTSNSWGGGGYNPLMFDAIEDANRSNILFIAAAGNDESNNDFNPNYPSDYTNANIIAVAATHNRDGLASFSNYGLTTIDLGAPGVNIASCVISSQYGYMSGTSMATPHVAGAVALAMSVNPDIPAPYIKQAILDGVDVLPSLTNKTVTGGRLNIYKTLSLLGLVVNGSTPKDGELVPVPPTNFVISFSEAYSAGSLAASDFEVNGTPADSVTLDSPTAVTFTYNTSPATNQGPQAMTIAEAAILDAAEETGIKAWNAGFFYDAQILMVTGTYPVAESKVQSPLTNITVYFNEAIQTQSLHRFDFRFSPGSCSQVRAIASNAVMLTVSGLVEEATVTLNISPNMITDIHGNPGSAPYSTFYYHDFETRDITPSFTKVDPAGSLVYQAEVFGRIDPAGDTDSYTFSLNAGQTLALVAEPYATNLQLAVSLSGPAGVISNFQSAVAGADAFLFATPITNAGLHTVTVSALAGGLTNRYSLHAYLNTAFEAENFFPAQSNSTPALAQNVDAHFIPVATNVSRVSILGLGDGLPPGPPDAYGYVAVPTAHVFEDIKYTGTAMMRYGLDNYEELNLWYDLDQFKFKLYGEQWGSFYINCNGMICRGSGYGFGGNTDLTDYPWYSVISPYWDELELIGSDLGAVYWELRGEKPYRRLILQWQDAMVGVGYASEAIGPITFQAIIYETINDIVFAYPDIDETQGKGDALGAGATVGIKGSGVQTTLIPSQRLLVSYNTDTNPLVKSGRSLRIALNLPTNQTPDHYEFTATAGSLVSLTVSPPTALLEPLVLLDSANNVLAVSDEVAENAVVLNGFQIPADGVYRVQLAGAGSSQYMLNIFRESGFEVEANDSISTATTIPAGGAVMGCIESTNANVNSDYYRFYLLSNDTVSVTTYTPGDGPYLFGNTLNPRIYIYDPNGAQKNSATSGMPDGKNVRTTYTAVTNGTHYLRIQAESGTSGEYLFTAIFPPRGSAPWVNLTAPVNNYGGDKDFPLLITANAGDSDGTVTKVEFFSNGSKLGEDTSAPYSFNWATPALGTNILRATATDNSGLTGFSLLVTNYTVVCLPNQDPEEKYVYDNYELERAIYYGAFTSLAELDALRPDLADVVDVPNLSSPYTTTNEFGMRFNGWFWAMTNGQYSFKLRTRGISGVWISDTQIFGSTQNGYKEETARIGLKEGLHRFRVSYYNDTNETSQMNFFYGGPAESWTNAMPFYVFYRPQQHVSVTATRPYAAEEPLTAGQFTFTRAPQGSLIPITLTNTVFSGSAVRGTDYTFAEPITFNYGVHSTNIAVVPIVDGVPESAETVNMTLHEWPWHQVTYFRYYVVEAPSNATVMIADELQILATPSSLSVTEGSSATFQVKLAGVPANDVTVSLARVSGDTDITVSPSSRVFTPANWDVNQTATAAAAHDADDINGIAVIRCSSPGFSPADVTVTEADDEMAPRLVSAQATGSTKVLLTFNTPVNQTAAQTIANYSLSWGLSVSSAARVSTNFYQVSLTVSTMANGVFYTVGAQNIPSVSGVPMTNISYASFQYVNASTVFYDEPLDVNPGWQTEGQWAFGMPMGLGGGEAGDPDPASGHTGDHVYGYNLAGDYTSFLPFTYLTSKPIDCSNYTNVVFSFWRWLNIEEAVYDYANVQVSVDGISWVNIWHSDIYWEETASSWTKYTTNLAHIVDRQPTVYFRWGLTTDELKNYSGWNIDDIQLTGRSLGTPAALQPSVSRMAVPEGGSRTFTVRLTGLAMPAVTVTVARASGDADITVQSAAQLVFNQQNWTNAQTVALAAAFDSDALNGSATMRLSAPGYAPVEVQVLEEDNAPIYRLPFSETFENDGTNAGTLGNLDGQHGWQTTNAFVTSAAAQGGVQSARLNAGQMRHGFSVKTNKTWVTFRAQPLPGDYPSAIPDDVSTVFYINSISNVVAWSNGTEVVLRAKVSTGWNRFEICSDHDARTWSLALNGTNLFSGFGFYSANRSHLSALEIVSGQAADAFVDTVQATWYDPALGQPVLKTLTVRSPYGHPEPSDTMHYISGLPFSCSMGGSPEIHFPTSLVCIGWTLTGNEPASGSTTNFTLVLTNDAVLSWLWQTNTLSTTPSMARGPANLNFSYRLGDATPASQTFTVTNSGAGLLHVANGWNADWLYVSPEKASGIAAGDSRAFTVSLLTDGLQAGVSNATITIGSSNAWNAPLTIPVALEIIQPVYTCRLTVASAHGLPTPARGTATYTNGVLNVFMDGTSIATATSTIYCAGWTLSNHEPGGGFNTSFELRLTNNTTLTWLWATNVTAHNPELRRMLFDFGPVGTMTTGKWNNVLTTTTGIKLTNMVDDTGTRWDHRLLITDAFEGSGANGYTGAVLYTQTARIDYFYAWGGNPGKFRMEGLSPEKAYDFTFYSTYFYDNNSTSEFKIGSTTVSIDPAYNVSNLLTIAGVIPSSSGTVDVAVNEGISTYGFLNVMEVTWTNWIPQVPAIMCTITVTSAHGTPVPAGVQAYRLGSNVTARVAGSPIVNGSTAIYCTGWTLTGHLPSSGSGTSCTFTANNHGTLTWLWATNSQFASNTLTVSSAYGTPVPAVGNHLFDNVTPVSLSVGGSPIVNGQTSIVCTGWTMTGHTPGRGLGTNVTMTLTNNATLTWNWVTNVSLPKVTHRLLFDFGTNSLPTAGNWNNVMTNEITVAPQVANAITTSGVLSGISLTITDPFSRPPLMGGVNSSARYPASAQSDHFVARSSDIGVIRLDGLESNKIYRFTFFGSSKDAGLRNSLYTIGSSSVQLDALNNTSNTVSISNVVPNAGGYVMIQVSCPTSDDRGYLNVMEVEWESSVATLTVVSPQGAPEPSGTTTYPAGRVLTNTVSSPVIQGATQYVCTGWTMTGNAPASGSTNVCVMTLTNNATLTWLWTAHVDTTYVLPWRETFENDGTNAGTIGSLNGQHGWTASGATVTNGAAQGGTQSARLSAGSMWHTFVNGTNEVWISFWVKPVAGSTNSAFSTNATAVFYVNTNGYIVAYSNGSAQVSGGRCQEGEWNKFEVYCNYVSKQWKLSLNGTNLFNNFGFYSTGLSRFAALGVVSEAVSNGFVDTIAMDLSDPSVPDDPDTDGDGLPDDWEQEHLGNLASNPGDLAANGINTVLECYITGLDPTDPSGRFLITNLRPLTSGSILQWQGVSGRVYTVYWTSNLLSGFQLLQSNVPWTGNVFTDAVHGAAGQGFYKIDVKLE